MTWIALITLASAAVAVASTWTTARLAWRDGQHVATVAVRGSTYILRDGRTVRRLPHYRRVARRRPWWWFAVSPQRLTGLAILIAGRRGDDVCCEWRSHLAGETGAGWPEGRQVREAAEFVLAAVRYRLYDLAELLWRPAEVLLASRGAFRPVRPAPDALRVGSVLGCGRAARPGRPPRGCGRGMGRYLRVDPGWSALARREAA